MCKLFQQGDSKFNQSIYTMTCDITFYFLYSQTDKSDQTSRIIITTGVGRKE